METQAKTEVVHIRIPVDLMKKIKRVAKREDRTHSQQILRALKEWAKTEPDK